MKNINITSTGVIMTLLFAVAFIYLISQFITTGSEGIGFTFPTSADSTVLMTFKILIVGCAILFGYALFTKFTGSSMNRRDVATLIILAVVVYFLWDQVLYKILSAHDLNSIAFEIKKSTLG